MPNVGDRFRTREPLPVTCWWWYDTVAIVDDTSDCCDAVLPAGESFSVEQVAENDPGRVLCRLDRADALKAQLIPRKRQVSTLGCRATPYSVELTLEQIETQCDRL